MIGLAKRAPGPGNLSLLERPEPILAGGEVLVQVLVAGICGTDLHIAAGEFETRTPVTLGHEFCGRVRAIGKGVAHEWLGVRVVAETFFSVCGICQACRDGRPNLCLQRQSIGVHVDGAFAPEVRLPAGNLHRVPDPLTDEAAALAEPLACVCQCLLDPSVVAPGDSVLVIGPGPIGLLAAQVARLLGGQVKVKGRPEDVDRLGVAESLGFTVEDDDFARGAFDVAVEASGSPGGLRDALQALRKGGCYVQVGLFGQEVLAPLDQLVLRELSVRTGFATTPRAWRRALQLMEDGRIDLHRLVSDVVPLTDWQVAFSALRAGSALKVLLNPVGAR